MTKTISQSSSHCLRLAAVAASILLPALARAQTYSPTILGTLRTGGGGEGGSFARGINDSGAVVGGAVCDNGNFAVFRWTEQSGMQSLGQFIQPLTSYAFGINASGEACGFGLTQHSGFASGIRIANQSLNDLLELPGGGDGVAFGISDNGIIVGWSNSSQGCGSPPCQGNPGRAVQWIASSPSILPNLGGYYSAATDISPDGNLVCGYAAIPSGAVTRGFRLQLSSEAIAALEPLAGDIAAYAQGINNAGDVVGYSESISGARTAVLWSSTMPVSLGVPAGAVGSGASAISESGAIIGWSHTGGRTHGARYSRNGPPVDLNDVIAPMSGWVCEYAASINARGDIVGEAFNGVDFRAIVLRACRGDFNGDFALDFFDYLDFVDAFASLDSAADFNGDSTIDFFDYLDFVDAFSQGC